MTNLQDKALSGDRQAILDLVEENKMSQQVKDMIPEMRNLIILAEVLDDMADAFELIEERYDEEEV